MKLYSNTIKELIAKYKWNSLAVQYFKKIALTILIPILICSFIIATMYHKNAVNLIDQTVNHDFQTQLRKINSSFDETVKIIETLLLDTYIKQFIYASDPDLFANYDNYLHNMIYNSGMLLTGLHATANYVNSIHIYNHNTGQSLSSNAKPNLLEIIDEARRNTDTSYICVKDAEDNLVNVVRNIKSGNTLQSTIVVSLEQNTVNSNLEYIKVIIKSKNDETLYTNSKDLYGASTAELKEKVTKSKPSIFFFKKSLTLESELEFANLTAFMEFDLNHFSQQSSHIIYVLCIAVIISLFVTIILSTYMSLDYYNAITNIISILQTEIAIGTDEDKNELSYIIATISGMSKKIHNMENDLTERLIALKKNQISALQNQINPHFVFNTLNSINLCIMDKFNGVSEPSIMIKNLSDILAENMATSVYTTTIEKELDYVKKYLEIESIRQMNNFNVVWDIDETLLQCKTIKMILQPVIENSLTHGIYESGIKNGKIRISIKAVNQNIRFCVEDNGSGFSREALKSIRKKLSEQQMPSSRHIGLININIRIKILYGEQYGVSIESVPGKTRVFIKIPYLPNDTI